MSGQSTRILVVEDEAVVAMDIEQTLMKLGYSVAVAHSNQEALEQAENAHPDLVLMDILLGDGPDGIDTANQIRQRFGTSSVYLTANADESTIQRAKESEPAGYILKPFRERELHATVQMALSRISIAERLKRQQTWHTAILHSMSDPVITVARDRAVTFMNQAAEEMVGCKPGEGTGQDCANLAPMLNRPEFARRVTQAIEEGVALQIGDLPMDPGQENSRLFQGDSIAPMLGGDGKVSGAVVVFRLAGGRRLSAPIQTAGAEQRPIPAGGAAPAVDMADVLTGLPSRAQAERAMSRVVRRRARAFAAAIAVDRFETIQHRFGASAADEVLLFMSLHLAQELPAGDQLYRWSGPVFLVLMERLQPLEDVRREIAHLTSMRLERLLHLRARSALVVVTAHWNVFPLFAGETPEEVALAIDRWLAGEPQ